jgi:hypothetical protein
MRADKKASFVSNLEIGTLKVHRLVYTPVASRRRAGNSAGPFLINLCAVLQKEPMEIIAMAGTKGMPETEEEVAKLTLDEVNPEIQRCLDGAYSGGLGSQGHESFSNRLVWMVNIRETPRNIGTAPCFGRFKLNHCRMANVRNRSPQNPLRIATTRNRD